MGKNLVLKYKKLAQKATFANKFIECCLKADENKSLYDNNLSTGCGIEGKCIKVKTIEKYCGKKVMEEFFNTLKKVKDGLLTDLTSMVMMAHFTHGMEWAVLTKSIGIVEMVIITYLSMMKTS